MGGWDCPNELNGKCMRVKSSPCEPGMRGCILRGRFAINNTNSVILKTKPKVKTKTKSKDGTPSKKGSQ